MVELIAKRYGTAIYELAIENNQIDVISAELSYMKSVIESEKDFIQILNHPKIVVEEKVTLVESVFKGKISDEVLGLIILTIIKGRQSYLQSIIEYCEDAFDAYNNIVTAYITSTDSLDKKEKLRLQNRIEEITGKIVNTEFDIDSSLIGGLIIRIGDRILDSSIKGKIANLQKSLYEFSDVI